MEMIWPITYKGNEKARQILGICVVSVLKEPKILKILLSGPSGVGKNYTIDAIADFMSLPVIEVSGRDIATNADLRRVLYRAYQSALTHKGGLVFIDEAQSMSKLGQQLILKPMEQGEFVWETGGDPIPLPNTHWIIATTKPEGLIVDIHTRCKEIILEKLSDDDLYDLVVDMLGDQASASLADGIVKQSNGIPREAKNLVRDALDHVLVRGSVDKQSLLAQAGLSPAGLNPRQEILIRILHDLDGVSSMQRLVDISGFSMPLVRQEQSALSKLGFVKVGSSGTILSSKGLRHLENDLA